MVEPITPKAGEPTPGTPAPGTPGSEPKPATPPVTPAAKPPEPAKPAAPQPPAGQPAPTPPATPPATPPVGQPGVTPPPGAPTGEPQTVPIGALLDERNKRQALENEVAALKQAPGASPYGQPPQAQPQQQVQPQNVNAQLDELWKTDPRQAVNQTLLMGIDWYDRVNNAIDVQADQLAGKYADFNTHRLAATRYVRSMPVQQRGMPGAVEAAYFYVKGQNVDEIIKASEIEIARKIAAGEMVATPPGGMQTAPAPVPGAVAATPEQRAVAQAMGMSEGDYMANIKKQPAGAPQ